LVARWRHFITTIHLWANSPGSHRVYSFVGWVYCAGVRRCAACVASQTSSIYVTACPTNRTIGRSNSQRASHQNDPVLSWLVLAGGGPVNSAVRHLLLNAEAPVKPTRDSYIEVVAFAVGDFAAVPVFVALERIVQHSLPTDVCGHWIAFRRLSHV